MRTCCVTQAEVEVAQSCLTLCDPVDYTVLGILQARMNTGVGSLSLLQGIFPTQGSNPGLPNCRQVFYQLSHKGSPSGTGMLLHALWWPEWERSPKGTPRIYGECTWQWVCMHVCVAESFCCTVEANTTKATILQ